MLRNPSVVKSCSVEHKANLLPTRTSLRAASGAFTSATSYQSCRLVVRAQEINGQAQLDVGVSGNGAGQPGLIFSRGSHHCWDAGGVGNPVVRYFRSDEAERWMMWYNGYDDKAVSQTLPPACIGLATSSDGVRWQRGDATSQPKVQEPSEVGRVMAPNEDWWWHDTRHLSVSDVQMFSSESVNTGVGVYWMYYTGGSYEEADSPSGLPGMPHPQSLEGLRTRIGLALSQDGSNFARIEANHHSGALFDAGKDEEWDHLLNAAPQVLSFGAKDRKMYYHSFDTAKRKWIVGLAISSDGFNWKKQGAIFEGGSGSDFDARGVASHQVVRDIDSRRYVMFYEAVAEDDSRTISIAVSKDGVKGWKRLGRPVLTPGWEGSWDSGSVGTPCPVSMADGKWRLYYGGRQAGRVWQGIGLAISDTSNDEMFEGVRIGFKRRHS